MRDRLSAAARQRAARPKALVWIYAALGLAVLVILVGQLAGWWPSPVENRIRANHRPADASKPTPPSPPPSPSDAPMSDAPMSGTEDSK